ncbi:glyoxalase/bleomycin resistance/extradiol dioxygenase family protein [Paenibacillaceae bacterium]|nr:glyoxalase/bleomycin resistance/extradiol dioxygenase family protein [Paenibacillaceae bacterium]
MALQAKKVFINLPVKDLNKSVAFFTELGFEFNPNYTDENATCMIINDNTFVMLLVNPFFQSFTNKPLSDATSQTEVIVSLYADSKEQVDELVSTARAAGADVTSEPYDLDFMYSWSFHDIDGHLWEFCYMDENTPAEA